MRTCPVCRGEVDPADAARNHRMVYYSGSFYFLLSLDCADRFLREPEKYARGLEEAPITPARCNDGNNRRGANS